MLSVKILALEIGALLMYAGIKGISVGGLLKGDNTQAATNTSLSASSATSTGSQTG